MNGWPALRADPIPWLLDERQPNLVWRVLVELFGRPAGSPAVSRARGAASAAEPVATLIERLAPDGTWMDRAGRWSRFRGTGWRLVAAVAWGADPDDPRVQAGCERLLAEEPGDGGFSLRRGEPPSPPLTARAVEALARVGQLRHLRGQEALAWLEEEADLGPVAATATLAALAEDPTTRRPCLASRCVDVLLDQLGRMDDRRGSFRLGHPNLLRTDPLEMLRALAAARVPFEPRMRGPLAEVQRLQDEQARWRLGQVPPRSLPLGDEAPRRGEPSPWLTLSAVGVLLRHGEAANLPRLFPEPRR